MIPNQILVDIFQTKKTLDLDGKDRVVNYLIGEPESHVLYKMFKKANTAFSIVIGLAHGVSANARLFKKLNITISLNF